MSGSFEDVYAIQKLKYRYGTALDTKDFVAMTDLMVDDVTVAYGGGAVTLQGREVVRDWMTKAMGSHSRRPPARATIRWAVWASASYGGSVMTTSIEASGRDAIPARQSPVRSSRAPPRGA